MLDFKDEVVSFKYKDKQYEVEKPTVKQSREYAKALKEAKDDETKEECLFDFLEVLGLPKEDAYTLKQNHILQIVQSLGESEKN